MHKVGKCPLAEPEAPTPEATTSKAAPPQKSFASASSAAEKGSWAAGTSAAEKVAKAHQSKLKKEAQLLLQGPEPKKKQSQARWASLLSSEDEDELGPAKAKAAKPKPKPAESPVSDTKATAEVIASAPWRQPAAAPQQEPSQPSDAPAQEEARPASGNLTFGNLQKEDCKAEPSDGEEYDFASTPPGERRQAEDGDAGADTDPESAEPAPELQRPPRIRKLVQQLGSVAEMAGLPAASQTALKRLFEEMKLEVQSLLAPAAAAAHEIAMKGLRLTDPAPVLA